MIEHAAGGLKACLNDNTQDPSLNDPMFYRSTVQLAKRWNAAGNRAETFYNKGGPAADRAERPHTLRTPSAVAPAILPLPSSPSACLLIRLSLPPSVPFSLPPLRLRQLVGSLRTPPLGRPRFRCCSDCLRLCHCVCLLAHRRALPDPLLLGRSELHGRWSVGSVWVCAMPGAPT